MCLTDNPEIIYETTNTHILKYRLSVFHTGKNVLDIWDHNFFFSFYLYVLFLVLVTCNEEDWLQITSQFEEFVYSVSLGFYFWCVANQIVVGGTCNEATEGICIRVKIQINILHNREEKKTHQHHRNNLGCQFPLSPHRQHSLLYFAAYFVFCSP